MTAMMSSAVTRARCSGWLIALAMLGAACHDAGDGGIGVRTAATNGTFQQRPARWLDVSPPEGERHGGRTLVYHDARKRVLLLDFGQMWEWTGQRWLAVPNGTGGPATFDAAIYHPERQSIVTFGGSDGVAVHDQTWEWDGNQWSNRTLASAKPSARWGTALAWDGHMGRIVMFGGFENPDYPFRASPAALWEWDAATGGWATVEPATAVRPAARGLHDMVWDATRGRVVLFGSIPMDVWEWASGARIWTERPFPLDRSVDRQSHTAVYDPDRSVMVLVGGVGSTSERFALEWDPVAAEFTDLVSSARPPPAARILAAAAYDAQRRRLVVTAGLTSDWKQGFNDVWELAPSIAPSVDADVGDAPPMLLPPDAAAPPGPDAAADVAGGGPDGGPAGTTPPVDGGPSGTLPEPGPRPEPGLPQPGRDAGALPVQDGPAAATAPAVRPGAYAGCGVAGGAAPRAPAGAGNLALVALAPLAPLLARRRRPRRRRR
jgi:hypothetical protein